MREATNPRENNQGHTRDFVDKVLALPGVYRDDVEEGCAAPRNFHVRVSIVPAVYDSSGDIAVKNNSYLQDRELFTFPMVPLVLEWLAQMMWHGIPKHDSPLHSVPKTATVGSCQSKDTPLA